MRKLNGQKIRDFLQEKGVRREWLATQLDVSATLVNQMLTGKIPHLTTVLNLAQIIGCKIDDLIVEQSEAKAS
jgi:transcriptional regulator with XRE-family HTH domain